MNTAAMRFWRSLLVSSAIIAVLSTTAAAAQEASSRALPAQPEGTLGGTIVVVIGNGNGLAAVTDSRLSSGGRTVSDHGEKMILMDDHTLCVIAGWYSNSGPTLDKTTFPAYAAVPGIVRSFAQRESVASKSSPVETRIGALARDVAYALNAVQQVALWRGDKTQPDASEITIAASVGNHIEVARMDLNPVPQANGSYGFIPTLRRKFDVTDVVQYEVSGMEDVGRPILDGTDTKVDDPTIMQFRQAVREDGGRSLSIEDLIDAARKAEILTSKRVGNVVGGPIEIGTIEHGVAKIVQDNPMLTPEDKRASAQFSMMEGVSFSGGGVNLDAGDGIVLFTDSQLGHGTYKLDGMLFYNNLFDSCVLMYDGSPKTIFDASNKVSDSRLVVTRKEYLQTPLVVQMVKDFPNLKLGIKRQPTTSDTE